MNQYQDIYAAPNAVATQPVESRAQFIRKTYLHLAGAFGVFCLLLFGITASIIQSGKSLEVIGMLGGMGWIVVLVLFMGTSWIANKWAHSSTSKGMQYAGLGLYTVAEALIFTPLILIVMHMLGVENGLALLGKAGIITGTLFGALSFIALTTKKDFSFLGGFLKFAFFIVLGLIVASFFGLSLGIWFSVAMVVLAGVSILYNTSNMIHHYNTDQYVAASLGLFASVALLLWYVIQILLSMASSE